MRGALDRLAARVPAALRQPLGFALVGCAGFATDALLFLLLTRGLEVPIYPARVLAFIPATVVTWQLNRHLVFRTGDAPHRRRDEYLRHIAVQSLGIAVNFASFTFAVETGLGAGNAQLVPLAIGSLAAMVFNYLGSRRYVFRR